LTDTALGDLITGSFQHEGNMDEVRYWMVKETASKKLDHPRGSKFSYCNLCYTVAGAIEERVSGKTWEELIEERVVEPLGLKTAGFGPQASLGRVDAPFGHTIIGGKLKPMLPGPNGDNPYASHEHRQRAMVRLLLERASVLAGLRGPVMRQ
jgi:CubicO group peptidase (beta-lactamase class C family)